MEHRAVFRAIFAFSVLVTVFAMLVAQAFPEIGELAVAIAFLAALIFSLAATRPRPAADPGSSRAQSHPADPGLRS
jgi:hypothetical protein